MKLGKIMRLRLRPCQELFMDGASKGEEMLGLDWGFVTRVSPTRQGVPFHDYQRKDFVLHDLAELFHENSKQTRHGEREASLAGAIFSSPGMVERQAGVMPRNPHLPRLTLPAPCAAFEAASIAEVSRARKSVRRFTGAPLALEVLSGLLHYSYGVTRRFVFNKPGSWEEVTQRFRPVPSGGGLYPLRLFVAVLDAEGLEPGIYHYDAGGHALEVWKGGREAVDEVLSAFTMKDLIDVHQASVLVLLAPSFWRSRAKYGLRGYRFCLMEAGHVAQAICMVAAAAGAGALPACCFYEDEVDAALGLDGVEDSVVYAILLGQADAEREPRQEPLGPGGALTMEGPF